MVFVIKNKAINIRIFIVKYFIYNYYKNSDIVLNRC